MDKAVKRYRLKVKDHPFYLAGVQEAPPDKAGTPGTWQINLLGASQKELAEIWTEESLKNLHPMVVLIEGLLQLQFEREEIHG
ncbi:MAG: hypothetical protein Unbinned3891contig1000_49 [Prokaryotic dsDNA virus sp.]|nr:MAG: hypothetical protein Unbinned3891contig1000_49 [Prokaryotic dsDNA virus sp.]|tara:strand:- start:66236 stop:66484 length:249 start_codon:yes stop_codon:yes gene_type:complete